MAKTYFASPFLNHFELSGDVPNFINGTTYKIKNTNSGLYMKVTGGILEDGTNAQQWGTMDGTIHDIWKIIQADKGYYYLVSGIGDGGTFVLDIQNQGK